MTKNDISNLNKNIKENGNSNPNTNLNLDKYKVDNAIIMAAGMSSRFAPLSYDQPKGLVKVKGEVLIERQIRQLHEVGIKDIVIVTGYLADQFHYLKDKYNVKIINNPDYHKYNNTSSLMLVLNYLKNTYICSSDNYFLENPFNKYEYHSYYPVKISQEESNEYYVTFNEDYLITDVNFDRGEYYMMGHVYFDQKTSHAFSKILESEYKRTDVKEMLWEKLYIEFIDEIDLYAKIDKDDIIQEFDSFEELRDFDSDYLNYQNNSNLNEISQELDIEVKDIKNIENEFNSDLENSFSFEALNDKYIYIKGKSEFRIVKSK